VPVELTGYRRKPDPPLLWWGVLAVDIFDDKGQEVVTEHRAFIIGALTEADALVRLEEYRLLHAGGFDAAIVDDPWPLAEPAMQVSSTQAGIEYLNPPSHRALP
jgi:hypothetical protein